MARTLPNDADGDALRRLAEDGSDLTKPMVIDFAVAVPDESAGRRIAAAAVKVGFSAGIDQDGESGEWTCYCTRTMVPEYEEIIRQQELLDRIGQPHGGYCDGWGSFGNAPES